MLEDAGQMAAWEAVRHIDCSAAAIAGCNQVPLLGPDASINALLMAELSTLVIAVPNTTPSQSAGRKIGVSWDSMVDTGSGIAGAELCVSAVNFAPTACSVITPMTGAAVVSLPASVPSGTRVVATLCATDYGGRKACRSSAGTIVYTQNAPIGAMNTVAWILPPPRNAWERGSALPRANACD